MKIIKYIKDKIALRKSPYSIAQLPNGDWVACYNDHYLRTVFGKTYICDARDADTFSIRSNAVNLCEYHKQLMDKEKSISECKKEKIKI